MAEDSTNEHERLVLSGDLNQVIVPRSSVHILEEAGGVWFRRVCIKEKKLQLRLCIR